MRPSGTTHSTGLHGRGLHGTWLRPAALGARCMALGCDEGPDLALWLLCSESPAHGACGTRALTEAAPRGRPSRNRSHDLTHS